MTNASPQIGNKLHHFCKITLLRLKEEIDSILINTAVLRKLFIMILHQLLVCKGSHHDCWGSTTLTQHLAKFDGR